MSRGRRVHARASQAGFRRIDVRSCLRHESTSLGAGHDIRPSPLPAPVPSPQRRLEGVAGRLRGRLLPAAPPGATSARPWRRSRAPAGRERDPDALPRRQQVFRNEAGPACRRDHAGDAPAVAERSRATARAGGGVQKYSAFLREIARDRTRGRRAAATTARRATTPCGTRNTSCRPLPWPSSPWWRSLWSRCGSPASSGPPPTRRTRPGQSTAPPRSAPAAATGPSTARGCRTSMRRPRPATTPPSRRSRRSASLATTCRCVRHPPADLPGAGGRRAGRHHRLGDGRVVATVVVPGTTVARAAPGRRAASSPPAPAAALRPGGMPQAASATSCSLAAAPTATRV